MAPDHGDEVAAAAGVALHPEQSDAVSEYAAYAGPGSHNSDDDDDDDADEDDDEDKNLYALHNLVEQGAIDSLRALLPLKAARKTVERGASAREDEEDDDDEQTYSRSMHVMANESLLLEKDDMGCLPIHIAIIYQRRECAMHLLQYSEALTSAMLRIKCGDLNTPIVHLILRVGALNPDFATHLISQLFNDAVSIDGEDSTRTLAAGFSDDVKALLFEKMVAKDEEGNTVFHLCAMYNLPVCLDVFAAFYTRQAEQHQQNSKYDDSNSSSAKSKKLLTIKPLLEKGNRVGFRSLHLAMKFHSTQVARQLVAGYGVNVNSVTTLQQTPVHIAALAGFADGVTLLLEDARAASLVDLALKDSHGYTALELAKKAKFARVARLLSGDPNGDDDDSDGKEQQAPVPTTKFFFHPESLRHLPMAYHRRGGPEPPPENPERVDTLVDPLFGILRSKEFVKDHVSWDYDIAHADIADVLRVHEFHYVDKIRKHCEQLADPVASENGDSDGDDDEDKAECGKVFALDPDTALSLRSYEAATRAAGAVCKAVDQVVNGDCTNAFCVVRPPGHHAGPVGKVVCANDPEGSHGFCLFNNVAVGAAYARSHYKSKGIHKIAILDFDVHHGNGTEEIVRQLVPRTEELRFETPYGEGKQIVHQYKPWRSEDDAENVFFCSVHGYGHKDPEYDHHTHGSGPQAAWFYPGSGESNVQQAPLIWNVGLEFCKDGASASRLKWRSAFRDAILPQLRAFEPDLIFLSAGFDAHKKENVNWGYVSLLEQDYEWLVRHVKQVANACCNGRLISVLEGGYNFHGRMISPFARSVAAHARALIHPSQELWDERDIAKEADHERALLANYTAAPQSAATGASSGVHTPHVVTSKKRSTDAGSSSTAAVEASAPMAVSRSKRARKDVDYVALAEEIAQNERK